MLIVYVWYVGLQMLTPIFDATHCCGSVFVVVSSTTFYWLMAELSIAQTPPPGGGGNLRLFTEIIQPTRTSLEELHGAIETWEAECQRCIGRMDEPLSDSARRLALQSTCSRSLSGRLEFHAARLGPCALLRADRDAYVDVHRAPSASGAVPVDVDSLT